MSNSLKILVPVKRVIDYAVCTARVLLDVLPTSLPGNLLCFQPTPN